MAPNEVKGPLCTRPSIAQNLRDLGLRSGDTVLVHSSLSKIGWVNGGAEAVVQALLDVVGSQGTLVVPTQTGGNSDPAEWCNPPVPREWLETIRDTMPPYDPQTSRTREMGVIAETMRTWHGAKRSGHPQVSFAAIGLNADTVTDSHELDCGLGDNSPLGKLEKLNARILLLGVGYDKCTAFHLAEYRALGATLEDALQPFQHRVVENGEAKWVTTQDIPVSDDNFDVIGQQFEEQTSHVVTGRVGAAGCKLFPLAEAVEHARKWHVQSRS